jgi:beta-N-acetylhexosaminidase
MSELEQWAGGVIVGGFDGTTLPDTVRDRLGQGHLGGVTLFKRNIVDPMQTAALCAAIADAGPSDLSPIVSIDQEGGRVARLGAPVLQLPPMRVLGRIDDAGLTRRVAHALADQLAAIGINLDFAPVADVDSNPANPVIGDRAFGSDPSLVSEHVVAFIEGLRDGGVLGCAKHFPGHGDTAHDSHLELPALRHDRARVDAVELPPFRAAVNARVASMMTAHVVFEGLAGEVPATLSRAVVTDLLRSELGFDGVCFSDDLHMKAISDRYTVERAAILAIEAGCDGLLVCTDPDSQERARLALVQQAQDHPDFANRLREAADRMTAMRRLAPLRPARDPEALLAVFHRADLAALRDEIFTRASRA